MTTIIIKGLVSFFIWLVFEQILCKQFKLKKNTKTFVNKDFKIVGISVLVFARMDFAKIVLNFR